MNKVMCPDCIKTKTTEEIKKSNDYAKKKWIEHLDYALLFEEYKKLLKKRCECIED